MERYDAIVLGAGGIGSAAMYHLASRGARVIGIDQLRPPHDRGSSHGQTRVIRQAYFEHPNYVPLLRESYRLWRELEARVERRLFHQVGLVEIGLEDGIVVPGVLRAAEEHNLAVERLTAHDVERRWSGLRVPGDLVGVYEPTAGYLLVEDCVEAHLQVAEAAGAELRIDKAIELREGRVWAADDRGVRLNLLHHEPIEADQLIICAGAWASELLANLAIKLTVLRKSLFWFKTNMADLEVSNGMPVYLFELSDGIFYGFPKLDPRGVKIAEHTGGRVTNPDSADRAPDPVEQDRLMRFLKKHLPGVTNQVSAHTVCLYTMSPDEHFIVDRHPQHPNVVLAAGLSGHGFKFAPVLGKALADLALDGGTELPIDFLSASRFTAKHTN
jgi:monomeric sarcosine oxidase